MHRNFWLILLLTSVVAFWVPAGWSQQEALVEESTEEEHAEEEHAEGPMAVVWRWFNFAVLFGGLGYLLRKPAAAFFAARRDTIQGGLERARTTQQDAETRMNDVSGRLARLNAEVSEIQEEAKATAQAEKERIVGDTRGEVDRAVQQSRAEVERLARGMGQEVRAHVADQVIARAREQIRSRMTPAERERTVRKAVEQL